MNSQLEAAAARLAAADEALTAAQATFNEAQSLADQRQSRFKSLTGDLAAIAARRQAGDERETDAATVSLLELDIKEYRPLLDATIQAETLARKTADDAQRNRDAAAKEMEKAVATEKATALEAHLRQVEATLIAGIAELAALKRTANPALTLAPATVFAPSGDLTRYLVHNQMPARRG